MKLFPQVSPVNLISGYYLLNITFLSKFLDNRRVRGYSVDAFCVIKESENYRKRRILADL